MTPITPGDGQNQSPPAAAPSRVRSVIDVLHRVPDGERGLDRLRPAWAAAATAASESCDTRRRAGQGVAVGQGSQQLRRGDALGAVGGGVADQDGGAGALHRDFDLGVGFFLDRGVEDGARFRVAGAEHRFGGWPRVGIRIVRYKPIAPATAKRRRLFIRTLSSAKRSASPKAAPVRGSAGRSRRLVLWPLRRLYRICGHRVRRPGAFPAALRLWDRRWRRGRRRCSIWAKEPEKPRSTSAAPGDWAAAGPGPISQASAAARRSVKRMSSPQPDVR